MDVSYNSAWSMKQEIIQVMKERDDSQSLSGIVQIDDAYYGGELHAGKRGRGSENKHLLLLLCRQTKKVHKVLKRRNSFGLIR
jgi:hypothetical protein